MPAAETESYLLSIPVEQKTTRLDHCVVMPYCPSIQAQLWVLVCIEATGQVQLPRDEFKKAEALAEHT